MKINYVLVDYENVQVKSLSLLKDDHFRLYVFLGPTNTKLPVELVLAMQKFADRAEYIVLETPGNNALDFHIAYYIGSLSRQDPTGFFHIISKDTGFDPLIHHLKEKKILSARSTTVEEMPCFATKPAAAGATEPATVEPGKNGTQQKPPLEEMIRITIADLTNRKTSRPASQKTLLSTIHARCGKHIPQPDIETVLNGLIVRGYVKINGEKVIYSLPGT